MLGAYLTGPGGVEDPGRLYPGPGFTEWLFCLLFCPLQHLESLSRDLFSSDAAVPHPVHRGTEFSLARNRTSQPVSELFSEAKHQRWGTIE